MKLSSLMYNQKYWWACLLYFFQLHPYKMNYSKKSTGRRSDLGKLVQLVHFWTIKLLLVSKEAEFGSLLFYESSLKFQNRFQKYEKFLSETIIFPIFKYLLQQIHLLTYIWDISVKRSGIWFSTKNKQRLVF